MATQSYVYLVLLGLLYLVSGQDNRAPDPNNHFVYPGLPGPQYSNDPSVYAKNMNLTYGVPQVAPFKWVTNLTYIKLSMHQEGNPNTVQSIDLQVCGRNLNSYMYWDGKLGPIDPDQGNIAFLAAWNCTSGGDVVGTPLFFSHYFNLTEAPGAQTTSVQSSATASGQTLSTAPATSTSSISSATQSSSPAASSTPPSSSSNAAALGGGIGGGIGGALLIIGAVFLYLRHRKSQRKERQLEYQNHRGDYRDQNNLPIVTDNSTTQYARPVEKPAYNTYNVPSELHSNQMQQPYQYNRPSELS